MKRARLLILASSDRACSGGARCCRTSTPTRPTPAAGAASSPPRRRACSPSAPSSPPRFAGRLADRSHPVRGRRRGQAASPPPASAPRPGRLAGGLPRRHVRLRRRPHRRRPGPVGARAALGRLRGPPPGLRLQFTGQALGMAVGAFVAGYMVNLARAGRHVAGLRHRGGRASSLSGAAAARSPASARPTCDALPTAAGEAGRDRQRRGDPADLRHARAALDRGRHRRPRARLLRPVRVRACPPTP